MSGSATIAVDDPDTGERLHFSIYRNKHGTLVVQSLDRSTHVALAGSPRRREHLARFAEVASGTFGQKQTGELPVEAEAIRVELTGYDKKNPVPSSDRRRLRREARLRAIGEEGLLLAQMVVDSPQEPKLRFLEPIRAPLGAGPSIPAPLAARVPLGQNPTVVRYSEP